MQQPATRAFLAIALAAVTACSDETSDAADATPDVAVDAADVLDGADAADAEAAPGCADPSLDGPYEVTREPWAPADPQREGTLDAMIWYPSAGGAPDMSGAPYPLITLSHGFLMAPDVYEDVAHRVASHGFVVVGTKHVDTAEKVVEAVVEACETIPQSEQITRVSELFEAMFEPNHALRRPVDLTTLIDAVASRSAAGGDLEGLVDTSRVGAVGHSFGGYTSMMVSGAQLDTERIAATCPDGPQVADLLTGNTLRFLICALFSTTSPEALASPPDARDDRVAALVSLAGPVELVWGDEFGGLAELPVPSLWVYTDTDEAVTYESGPVAVYPVLPTPKYFLTVYGGNHGNFGTIDYDLYGSYTAQVPEGCVYGEFVASFVGDPEDQPGLDAAVQRHLTATGVAAFLQEHVAGATGCDAFLNAGFFETVGGDLASFTQD